MVSEVHVFNTAVAADERCDKDEFANSNCVKPTCLRNVVPSSSSSSSFVVVDVVVVVVVINARVA